MSLAVRVNVLMRLLLPGLVTLTGCVFQSDRPRHAEVQERTSAIRFRDVTARAGIAFSRSNGATGQRLMPETMGGGGGFIDYDNDGYPDIILVNGDWWPAHSGPGPRPSLALYHNNRDGTFSDTTREMGLAVSMQGMGVAVGDYDNDGYDDLYVTGVGGNRLFHNEGVQAFRRSGVQDTNSGAPSSALTTHDSRLTTPSTPHPLIASSPHRLFRDVTAAAGVGGASWSTSAAWLDYDNDGKLDLFVCHYVKWSPETDIRCGEAFKTYCNPRMYAGESCHLYHNQGQGRFADVTRTAGIYSERSKALGICVCDLNQDGHPDLIVANDVEPNFVYRNTGKGSFVEIGVPSGLALNDEGRPRAGMGIDAADYRNDGTRGIAIGNFYAEGLALYDITSQLPWTDRSREAGLFRPSYSYLTFGLFFADFDNDGWPDLFVANGHIYDTVELTNPGETYRQPGLVFRNRGDSTFQDVSRNAGDGVTRPMVGRGACRGDFDNDGREDALVICNSGPPRLLRNETTTDGHWLEVALAGGPGNRDGYGATVTVETGAVRRSAYASSGGSYLSAHDRRLHFGLGSYSRADSVTVRWPDGKTSKTAAVSGDRILVLHEP